MFWWALERLKDVPELSKPLSWLEGSQGWHLSSAVILLAGGDDHVSRPHPGECPFPCSISLGDLELEGVPYWKPTSLTVFRVGKGESEYKKVKRNQEGIWDEGWWDLDQSNSEDPQFQTLKKNLTLSICVWNLQLVLFSSPSSGCQTTGPSPGVASVEAPLPGGIPWPLKRPAICGSTPRGC